MLSVVVVSVVRTVEGDIEVYHIYSLFLISHEFFFISESFITIDIWMLDMLQFPCGN